MPKSKLITRAALERISRARKAGARIIKVRSTEVGMPIALAKLAGSTFLIFADGTAR